MGLVKGGFLRLLQTFLYAVAFCCSAIILGAYSYFLAHLAERNLSIETRWKAVEGLSGAAVLYTIFAVVLTCCLGGITFFAFLGLVLDVCFIGAMIAIAILTREGTEKCSGYVNTPIGSGQVGSTSDLGVACRLNTAAFAVSVIGAFIFLLTAIMQVVLARKHKKENRYGPSPANNYTSGSGANKRKFWQRKPKSTTEKDAEIGAAGLGAGASLGVGAAHHDLRPSHDTAYTGSTVAAPGPYAAKKEVDPSFDYNGVNHGDRVVNGVVYPSDVVVNPYEFGDVPATTTAGRNF